MKTKEELIEQSWGITWLCFQESEKQEVIKNNGYYNGFNDKVIDSIEWNEQLYDYRANKGYIPYDLIRIENNNNWIRINENLPTKTGYYLMYDGKNTVLIELNNTTDMLTLREQFIKDGFTHYQPIVKPKPPIY